MYKIDDIITCYGQLEIEVQQCMRRACEGYCAACATPCCREVYCRESLESIFLDRVRQRFAPTQHWDAAVGWLTPTGCCLPAGRPPVCHEFICRTILEAQPAPQQRAALETLAMLPTHAGRNASGRRHLVELTDLKRINTDRLMRQLVHARSVLESVRGELGHAAK